MTVTKKQNKESGEDVIPIAKHYVDHLKNERGVEDKFLLEILRNGFSFLDEKLNYKEELLDFRGDKNLIYHLFTRLGETLYQEKEYVLVPIDEERISKKLNKKLYDENGDPQYSIFWFDVDHFVRTCGIKSIFHMNDIRDRDYNYISFDEFFIYSSEIVVRDYINECLCKMDTFPLFGINGSLNSMRDSPLKRK